MNRNQTVLPKTDVNHSLRDQGIIIRQEKLYIDPESLLHPFYRIVNAHVRKSMTEWLIKVYLSFMGDALRIWKKKLEVLKGVVQRECSIKIQTIVRMWSLRNKIPKMREDWFRDQYQKWQEFHSQFNYSSNADPRAITFDNKIYFSTKRDANHYMKMLRAAVKKFMYHFEIHRTRTLRGMFRRWCAVWRELDYEDKKNSHWDMRMTNAAAGPDETEQERDRSIRLHAQVLQSLRVHKTIEGARRMGITDDDTKFNNVAAIPLAIQRDPAEGAPPPAVPATGVQLPPLPEVSADIGVDGTPVVHADKRPKFNSFIAKMVGPTDYSCWIIPGVLAMGAIPVGAARIKKRLSGGGLEIPQKDAVSKLVQAGVGQFVSLLPLEEEALEHLRRAAPASVESTVKSAEIEVRKSLKQSMLQLKFARDTETVKLEAMPTLHHTNERFAAMEKEKAKRQYKILVASRDYELAAAEFSALAARVSWRRYALSADPCPNKHELLPVIWAVEDLIAKKEVVYVYSNDGHGRAGVVCGCVLGRLYDLPSKDALFRLQLSHSSYVSLQNKPAVSCPQSPKQRILVQQVIEDAERAYEGALIRTQANPEIYEFKSEPRKPSCSTVTKKKKKNAPPDPMDPRRLHPSLSAERSKVAMFTQYDGPESWQQSGVKQDETEDGQADRVGTDARSPWGNQGVRVRGEQSGNEDLEHVVLRPEPAEKPTLPLLRNRVNA